MTAADAAALLGCSRRQVYLLAEKDALPGARRLGHSILVVRPVLERWLLTGSVEA
jgi:excisionase family DNA binding protein